MGSVEGTFFSLGTEKDSTSMCHAQAMPDFFVPGEKGAGAAAAAVGGELCQAAG